MANNPSVGRIVHYVLPAGTPWAGEHRPAMITQVFSGSTAVNLIVFKGQGDDFVIPEGSIGDSGPTAMRSSVPYSEGHETSTWHWPEFVPPGSRAEEVSIVSHPR